jgi:hypothetical protein
VACEPISWLRPQDWRNSPESAHSSAQAPVGSPTQSGCTWAELTFLGRAPPSEMSMHTPLLLARLGHLRKTEGHGALLQTAGRQQAGSSAVSIVGVMGQAVWAQGL